MLSRQRFDPNDVPTLSLFSILRECNFTCFGRERRAGVPGSTGAGMSELAGIEVDAELYDEFPDDELDVALDEVQSVRAHFSRLCQQCK